MFLLNLALPQLLGLMAGISALVVALYLLDRSRRRQVVATLRFWVASEKAAEVRRRKRIQQPLSLILQLLSIALLLLALAQLRVGSAGPKPRDHVLILETSAWMGAQSANGVLMDRARSLAAAYVNALPAGDRVMLVRADALASPATVFESNRQAVVRAIAEAAPGSTALNLDQAFEFARQAQRLQGNRRGEIVFVGSGRITEDQPELGTRDLPNLRVLSVPDDLENCGLRKMGLRRSTAEADAWEVLVGVRNYGSAPRTVTLGLMFGGAMVGTRRLALAPGVEQNAAFQLRTHAAGLLEARLLESDAFPEDNRAVLEIPQQHSLRVAVYSDQPDLLRPVLAASSVQPVFHLPSEYREEAGIDIVILDRFRPPTPPAKNAIWIEPPLNGAPIPVRATLSNVPLARWRSDQILASGLRAKDVKLDSTEVFRAAPDDIPIAEVEAGPVILARPGKIKTAVFGFHPVRSTLRYELTAPLLFANILHWMAPEIFRRWELNGGSAGTVNIELGPETDPASVRVLSATGSPLPYTIEGHSLRFFAGTPGTVKVLMGDREIVYSLMLPEVAEFRWHPPESARKGLPRTTPARLAYADLWQWLALAGALGLLLEWLLFGSARARLPRLTPGQAGQPAAEVRKAVGV